jgi:hypothetical protein
VTAPEDLIPGYSYRRQRGVASYSGALRTGPKDPPVWTCPDDHLVSSSAVRCAELEKDRRVQGAKQVMLLLHCEPCNLYFGEEGWHASDLYGECPYCEVPLSCVKVLVLERSA